jgi:CobQ-like glutamine amidotransferase family enzyme
MREKLVINWMFPDLLNLYGDCGNVMALSKIASLYGIESHILRVQDPGEIDPDGLVYFGAGEIKTIRHLFSKYEHLPQAVSGAKMIYFSSTSGIMLSYFPQLGVRYTERERDPLYWDSPTGDDIEIEAEGLPYTESVVGNYIRVVDFDVPDTLRPFGKIRYGLDNSGKLRHTGNEGVLQDNIFWTNILGPVLARNPWLALALLNMTLGTAFEPKPEHWVYEINSLSATREFIKRKLAK